MGLFHKRRLSSGNPFRQRVGSQESVSTGQTSKPPFRPSSKLQLSFTQAPNIVAEPPLPRAARARQFANPALAAQAAPEYMHLREQYWGPVQRISSSALVKLTLRILDPGNTLEGRGCWLLEAQEGHFNRAFIMKFSDGSKIVIRVPAAGWAARWAKEDEQCLKSEALTKRYIFENTTKVPLPEVLSYDTTFCNEIGAPYIMMTFSAGKPTTQAWYKEEEGGNDLEEKRKKILLSLAAVMRDLKTLRFDKIGMLDFESDDLSQPFVGTSYTVTSPYDIREHILQHGIAPAARKINSHPPTASYKDH